MGLDQVMPAGDDWIARKFADMQSQLDELRGARGLEAASITRGGLRLLDDAFLQMVSSLGYQILYVGPDTDGVQTFELRRDNGSLVMRLYTSGGGQQYWALYDRAERILFSDDAATGVGMARPWLAVPMYRLFDGPPGVYAYSNIAATDLVTEKSLWQGRIASVTHPRLEVDGAWGQASGSNNTTYRLKVNGTTIGTWTENGTFAITTKGPFNTEPWIDDAWAGVEITAIATGSGQVACHVYGCAMRQT